MNIIFASVAAIVLSTGSMSGAHRGGSVDDGLARAIALAASRSEAGMAPAKIRDATAAASTDVITMWGAPPRTVQQSLEWILEVCPGAEAQRLGYSCPTTPQAYQGLGDVLVRVARLAGQSAPAAGEAHGGEAPFGPPPDFTGGGGADYRGAP